MTRLRMAALLSVTHEAVGRDMYTLEEFSSYEIHCKTKQKAEKFLPERTWCCSLVLLFSLLKKGFHLFLTLFV